mmetsp:Transcript_9430/g.13838  ORF Transcript_9430/g.13838 Transcript_9430/m.13838 type:complete len:109 (-) Transcript_9430:781-1107(-)|eukprot:CAMPEP_0195510436 /NCGR_PEP_ID=MMETSP0794_2-20130614/3080_1 /TAXON_ID=515487 /ORGANISM="Stephanopyxis turris, Strain CCMP 815" /LENGTH=108 /DNA_ID=CAMNT_0040637855 /DNA_START=34 /DNA_END=360 /DNA_ORIENTATION=-
MTLSFRIIIAVVTILSTWIQQATGSSLRRRDMESFLGSLPDPKCFEAAWNPDDAEAACDGAVDKWGEPCMWCKMAEIQAGVCLSKKEAAKVNGKVSLSCGNSAEGKSV